MGFTEYLRLLLLFICAISSITWAVNASPAPAKKTLPATKINPKDGAVMVLVPAGEFLMGSKKEDQMSEENETPQHKVYLDSYYIYKTEVTVAQFRKFCHATGRKSMPKKPKWGWLDNHPIVNISWNDAAAYAKWAGAILPSEAQWEKAARGTDGRIFPWGNKWDTAKCVNFNNIKDGTNPVGSILAGVSPYGCLDMVGNVSEWCNDWYNSEYYNIAPLNNPMGPKTGKYRVLRGGSWYSYYFYYLDIRSAFRFIGVSSEDYNEYAGFRCASPVQ